MKNQKLILINGMARGGTNIIWNILASHPEIVSARRETGEILKFSNNRNIFGILRIWNLLRIPFIRKIYAKHVDNILYQIKINAIYDEAHKFKAKDIEYTRQEIENTILCLKSLNKQLLFTKYINMMFPQVYNIGIIRDGYALCNGYKRRGISAIQAGKMYRKYGEMIINDSKRFDKYYIVKFEDMIADPFGRAKELYEFVEVKNINIEMIRLKSKKVLNNSGQHQTKYGKAGRHYWLSPQNISEIIKPNINKIQEQQLTQEQIRRFAREAKPVLDYFSYSI